MRKFFFAALVAILAAGPTHAGERMPDFVQASALPAKRPLTLDPGMGYILMRSDVQTFLTFMRVPNDAEKAVYTRIRNEALGAARETYQKRLLAYDRAMRLPKDQRAAGLVRPVEPTEANFDYPAFELFASFTVGPLFRFEAKKGGGSTYLHMVKPGRYRIYGSVMFDGSGYIGTCFCMGSVQFDVPAGEITDLGLSSFKVPLSTPMPVAEKGDSSFPMLAERPNPHFMAAAPPELALDARLVGKPIRRAEFSPIGKLPNYYGVSIARIPPMPGVLAYDRDRIIDLTKVRNPQ